MHGSELIFLAEDDGSGRERVRSALIHFGYRVLSASNGEVALRLCEKETPSVAILDVVMVHVGGTATAVEPLPGLPILFTRGHSESTERSGSQIPVSCYLQKPYRATSVGWTIRQVLDEPSGRAS